MTEGRELVEELEEKGGLLGVLKEVLNKYNELGKEATKIWREAFRGSKVRISTNRIGVYYALMKAQYKRAKRHRKRELEKYLKEFENLYNIYKSIDAEEIRRLIRKGSYVYRLSSAEYNVFLKKLHEWIAEVWNYFVPKKDELSRIDMLKDVYKFVDKMILTVIDFSTVYTGEKNPAEYEFILSCFIHVENYVHYSAEYYEPTGKLPIAIAYLVEVMEALAEDVDYACVYPTVHVGNWEDEFYTNIISGLKDRDIEFLLKVGQFGYDLQNDVEELESLEDKFPSEFIVYDYMRGVVRRYLTAILEWDFLKLSISEIVSRYGTRS